MESEIANLDNINIRSRSDWALAIIVVAGASVERLVEKAATAGQGLVERRRHC